jgi:oligoendopeptidase F
MSQVKALPPRSKAKASDCWDLGKLFRSAVEWEKTFTKWTTKAKGYETFRSKLHESAATIAKVMQFDADINRIGEALAIYAYHRASEDLSHSDSQGRKGRFQHAAAQIAQAASWIHPELLAISPKKINRFLQSKELVP